MTVGCKAAHPLALRRPPAQRGHAGLDPDLIDEDQALWIEVRLPRLPAAGPARDVERSKANSVFLNRRPSHRRNVQTALCETSTPRTASSSCSLCSVRCGVWRIRSLRRDAVPAPACGVRLSCRGLLNQPPRTPPRQTASQPSGSFRPHSRLQRYAHADHSKEVGSSDAGPQTQPTSRITNRPPGDSLPIQPSHELL
jgi:hypothetical protein